MKAVVIGGGIIGLMTARELERARIDVVIVERGHCGQEASWAGGGIVSPLYPWRYSEPVTALASLAQTMYPELVEMLRDETGIDAELQQSGLLMLDAEDSRDAKVWANHHARLLQVLGTEQLQKQFSGISINWQQGLWMPELSSVRNPRLLKALKQSLLQQGVTVLEQAGIVRAEASGAKIKAVVTQKNERIEADVFVLCAGAWSPAILRLLSSETKLPVHPVRGQMISFQGSTHEEMPPCMMMGGGRYLVPRRDGLVLCGSTLEECGFDKSITSEAKESLHAAAAKLWPALANVSVAAHWAGLRPGSPNGIPFIGRDPSQENVWINTGHYRNGLVLAPAASQLMADLMLNRTPSIEPSPYSIEV